MNDTRLEFIKGELGCRELLTALAEEASELAHAALKLRRAIEGTNPTPVSVHNGRHALIEELTDLLVVSDVIGLEQCNKIREEKISRWVSRLLERHIMEDCESG